MIGFPYCLKSQFHIVEPNYLLLEIVHRMVPVQKATFCETQIHQNCTNT